MNNTYSSLLLPRENISFQILNDKKWVNKSKKVFVFKDKDGKWIWRLYPNGIFADLYNNISTIPIPSSKQTFKTRTEALENALEVISQIVPSNPLDEELIKASGTWNIQTHPYSQNFDCFKFKGSIGGTSGKWYLFLPDEISYQMHSMNKFFIYKDKQVDLKHQTFCTRKEIIDMIYAYISSNLQTLYKENIYTTYYPIITGKDQLNQYWSYHAWWMFYIRPDINLNEIFQ